MSGSPGAETVFPFDPEDMGMRFGMSESNPVGGDVDGPAEPDTSNRQSCGTDHSNRTVLVAATRVVGRKWHPVLVHRLLAEGPMGFSELKRDLNEISGKVLSESLDDLVDLGVVGREAVEIEDEPTRVSYSVTPAGRDLEPVIEAMADWGTEYGPHSTDE